MTTWRAELLEERHNHDESFKDIESSTLSEDELDREFDSGFGGTEGRPFTVWTKGRVYFPGCYDGLEWVDSVSRHPDGISTNHVGGG
jgi:hypothetical protein